MTRQVIRDGQVIIAGLTIADTLWSRMRGLLGTRSLPVYTGLQIVPCNAIHTWGMCYPIDVLFLDRDQTVIRIHYRLSPFHFAFGGRRAHSVIEVQSGWLQTEGISPGDRLAIIMS